MNEKESNFIENIVKLSHRKWRALLKKQKRKLKRQNEAQFRDKIETEETSKKEVSPSYQAREQHIKEIEELEEQREKAEKAYLNKLWLERERIAQEEFQRKKEREEKEKTKREAIEKKIREEWEERQKKEQEEQENEKEKKKRQDSLLQQATANENKDGDEPWHNPIASLIPGKEKETCPFYAKTGVCRFGERCSRGHPEPEGSSTVLIKGMYTHFELQQGLLEENDTDLLLEYDEGELDKNFQEFYDDIAPEFKSVGNVIQLKVSCNYEPHLRGNVYVQYSSPEEACAAIVKMNGRFYGGKQISCEPVEIKSWKSAICGLFGRGSCPKGRNCNFLHVFKNPRNEFRGYGNFPIRNSQSFRRYSRSRSKSPHNKRFHTQHSHFRSRNSVDYRLKSRYRSRSYRPSRSRSRNRLSRSRSRNRYSRSRSKNRHSRSRSRSWNRHSRSKSRNRHSRSRSSERYKRSRSRDKYSQFQSRYSRSRSKSKSRRESGQHKRHRHSRSRSSEKYLRSRSRSYSRLRSSSRSPSRHKNKKKKHKRKKHKKHSEFDKESDMPVNEVDRLSENNNSENGAFWFEEQNSILAEK